MGFWTPIKQDWAGQDVFIIGGGPSLAGFDFKLLRGKPTIGCNAMHRLGADICQICLFSDLTWYHNFKGELARFPGQVVTQYEQLAKANLPWLHVMHRERWGLHQNALGFGGNSGCSAVNLALILGAQRVYLLGCDCQMTPDKKTHWHTWAIQKQSPQVYHKFLKGWAAIAADLPKVFPGREIINLGPNSAIPYFPRQHWREVLQSAAA